ncbi:RibD family protein [Streptomonospora litoralis]|uniref:2,5-diamino-6-ribosylamino-4(3H)-pyrimidinone 5'-phosphate reductase n=1 Tax=Streptomonospora litoralis TaxID=2498135 RepID=A0A4P6Q2C1_9ACTN|nr:RibD family protein [Streptomonospora litoralis]QBI53391.1 2,5-diamino-6-ribosylamino-4(3H)-pyrimidinone 5'-phosphate reductase [Streptomonospora litoralis]
MSRPYTLLSCAMSLDGFIDDAGPERLRLSSAEDFNEVDELRAGCDAILVGAGTVRSDDPRLLVRSARRRARRIAEGRTGDLVKVVLSGSGRVDPASRVFTTGDAAKLVYVQPAAREAIARRFADAGRGEAGGASRVEVLDTGPDLCAVLADLAARGVERLLVEGGTGVHTRFLSAGLADEMRIAIAPFFVGDAAAPRFVGPADFAHGPAAPMRLAETRALGDMAILRYLSRDVESRR